MGCRAKIKKKQACLYICFLEVSVGVGCSGSACIIDIIMYIFFADVCVGVGGLGCSWYSPHNHITDWTSLLSEIRRGCLHLCEYHFACLLQTTIF